MRPRHDVQTVADKCRIVYKKGNFVETFSDKTEVSFRQLFKKDGWFSRLVVLHLIVIPIYTSIFYTFKSIRTPIPPNHPAPYILGSMPFCVELDNLKDTDAPIHQPAAMLVAAD